ncbi:hypothetical protein LNQ52_31890 [Klebsiella pneumoniae subsp. pneumoniae]|nr:hypothetical protein [Klebsiella pneumoniae subsp. pneumoniae]
MQIDQPGRYRLRYNQALTRKLLAKTARQAQGRCLGSEGIRLLACIPLQNELIAQGYITSLIDVPSQCAGARHTQVHACTMAKWALSTMPTARTPPRLWNSLPTSSGTILRLSDLEQGDGQPAAHLPGATAHMKLLPGQHEGESDIPDRPQPGEKMAAWHLA